MSCDCTHAGSFYIKVDPEGILGCFDFSTNRPVSVHCAECDKEFSATINVQLPPKCMIGAEHKTEDCPLRLPISAHGAVA